MKVFLSACLGLCLLALSLPGQRPRSVEDAVSGFQKIKDEAERRRHSAVRDLGRFEQPESTTILITELRRAKTISYRQTVVRAIGYKQRIGVIQPLTSALTEAQNPRLADAVAEAMRRQGKEGILALSNALPNAQSPSPQRNAICYALGRVEESDAARDALLADLQRAGGNDRLPALRGLAARHSDERVDAARVTLAGDKGILVASTALSQLTQHAHNEAPRLAIDLARRLPSDAGADLHAAVMAGLLAGLEPGYFKPLLFATVRAQDPFGERHQSNWRSALADGALLKWLASNAIKAKDDGLNLVTARICGCTSAAQRTEATSLLAELLHQTPPEVVRAAAVALIQIAPPAEASRLLDTTLRKADDATGPPLIGALHTLRHQEPSWHDELVALCGSKRAGIRAAALRALSTVDTATNVRLEAARKNLSHRQWQVRAAAIELIVSTRAPVSPPLLFARLDKESARMREDLRTALLDLTGLQFATRAQWKKWWQKESANFQPKTKAPKSTTKQPDATAASYWNIPVISDRVTFVIDVSGSMSQPFGTGNATRLTEAKRQLSGVFERLPSKAKTNVITFASGAEPLFEKLQSMGKKQRKQADAFVADLQAKGPTNVHDALAAAFRDPAIDTIFLLTDGRPSVGPMVDPVELADEVARWNLARSIRIHTIAIGEKSDFLMRLAKESGGQHVIAK